MKQKRIHIPTLDDLHTGLARIPKQWILAFAAACVLFVIVHAGYFDDRMLNEDYRHFISTSWQRISMGRFFCFYLITSYCNSWTFGCATCLYFALMAVLAVDLFRIRTKLGAVLTAALLVVMPSTSFMFGYMASAPLYGRMLFLAFLAVWVANRWRWGFLPAIVIFAVSLGVGQSALIAAAVLCILRLLQEMLTGEPFSYKAVLKKALRFLIMGIVGVVLYLLMWKVAMKIAGVRASDYKGMNEIGQIAIPQLLRSFKESYRSFLGFFFGEKFLYVSALQKAVYGILALAVCFSVVFAVVKKPLRAPGIALLLVLLPPIIGSIEILTQVGTDSLMIYPIVYLGVLAVHLAEDGLPENGFGRAASWIIALGLIVTCCSFLDITSAFYVQAETYQEHTVAYENRLLSRIEATEGYYPGIPVAIVSNGSSEYVGLKAADFDHAMNERGLWNSFVGTSSRVQEKTISLIQIYTGVKLTEATAAQVAEVSRSPEYAELEVYPLDGSIRIINGILTVNCTYNDVAVMQVDDRTVMAEYRSYTPWEDNVTYAWYVYRNGERMPELERGYTEAAQHLVTLTEDGAYTFKGYCSRSGKKTSLNGTTTVVVKNGVIVESPDLVRISMEEVLDRLPQPKVGVEVTPERGVRLSLLNPGFLTGSDYTYAWRVYRDGEHREEYDRGFDPQASYVLNAAEEGVYRFEVICRKGNTGEEITFQSEDTEIRDELSILRVDDCTVFLRFNGKETADRNADYAWYVMLNEERIPELGADYHNYTGHLVKLEKDGIYTFKCYIRTPENKRSILSFPVEVENGRITENPRLGQISLEDARRQMKPELEIQVKTAGERAVQLTVIDNSLNAGPEYTYAWYVYRNGERLQEYDRGYYQDPEYDLILAEDGVYQFKLFYRIGEIKKSVLSEEIRIGAAGSGEAAA